NLNVEATHRALSTRRIHQPLRGNFRLLLPRAGDCISQGRALDPACFAAGIEAGGRQEGLRGRTRSMAEEHIEEASMAIAGRGAWRRSRSKRRPWPWRRPRRSSSSSTSPSRSRVNIKHIYHTVADTEFHLLSLYIFSVILNRLSTIKMAEWNPEKDLLAMVTDDSKVLLHRFNWQRLWTISP
ncbi:hypothetical protein ACJX0J_022063, partial [Zea mays]